MNPELIKEIQSIVKGPQGMNINLGWNNIGSEGAQYLANAIQSGKAPQRLNINLFYNDIGPDGAQYLAKAIQNGQAPRGFTIDFGWNNIGPEGAQHLANAIQSGKAPQELTIDLGWNNIGQEGAQHLAKAIQSGKAPQGLNINLGGNDIGREGVTHLVKAIQSGQAPHGITITGHGVLLDACRAKRREEAMMTFATIAAGNRQDESVLSKIPIEIIRQIASYLPDEYLTKFTGKMLDAAYKHHYETKSQKQRNNSAIVFGMQPNVTENGGEHAATQRDQASNTH